MFESFYGLNCAPFSRDIPTPELYESVVLEETLGRLEYAAARKWFAVITGDCGTGKTTIIRRYAKILDPVKYKVLYMSDSRLINKVCTHCLLYGAQNGQRIIDDHMVKRVIEVELS